MDMIKVDPKLFVTCRLCLDEEGSYQITPMVQQQIEYCFGFEVNPFDGFPQLICSACETTLSNYYTTKKTYIGKQNALRAKLDVRINVELEKNNAAAQQPTVSSSHPDQSGIRLQSKAYKKKSKRGVSLSYSSGSEVDLDEKSRVIVPRKKKHKNKARKTSVQWEAVYHKTFVCNLCRAECRNKGSIKKHLIKHSDLISKYGEILNIRTSVKLIKIDAKPNPMNDARFVQFDECRVICDEGKTHYYSLYSKKTNVENASCPDKRSSTGDLNTSDEDDFNVKRGSRKRCRLLSKSSNETVVLEDEKSTTKAGSVPVTGINVPETNEIDCIDLDGSSDGEVCENNLQASASLSEQHSAKVDSADYTVIQNIITTCYEKYMKKNSAQTELKGSTEAEQQLKRKFLSIGTRILSKKSINCTGLLRYMENKNLNIIWIPSNAESKYVRIMPRLMKREPSKCNLGWKYISEELADLDQTNGLPTNATLTTGECNPYTKTCILEPEPIKNLVTPTSSQHILNCEPDMKLLNASPVANPKQLPKKMPNSDTKLLVAPSGNNTGDIIVGNNGEDKICMPVITSCSSLVEDQSIGKSSSNAASSINISTDSNILAPRIKVKPPSELMSEKFLNKFNKQQPSDSHNWDMDKDYYTVVPTVPFDSRNNVQYISLNSQQQSAQSVVTLIPRGSVLVTSQITAESQSVSREYVTLDCVELPNTKTDSPFTYLKNLLQIHGIYLRHTNETISNDFICLTKFKLQFTQDNANSPIVFCLSLHCLGNEFFFGIKQPNGTENINLNKFNAKWQWEILKCITSKDVGDKLLQSAEKRGQHVLQYTSRFLCILKSINLKS